MFNFLSEKLQNAIKQIRGLAKITESNISDALREVRRALLEADVHYTVVKDVIEKIKTQAVGTAVIQSITPGQQIVKIIHDSLVEILGGAASDITLVSGETRIMIVGINGSGKTTTAVKLAHYLKQKKAKKPCLVAADLARPAAIQQLEVLAERCGIPVYKKMNEKDPRIVCADIMNGVLTQRYSYDTVIFDTAGRLHVDEELMTELEELVAIVKPHEILLIADAMTGQDAVKVAESFAKRIAITGVILTKLDGDARGGAALSLKVITGCPLKMVGVGEKIDELEPFYPERMASRILGMGDIVSLVEKAQSVIDEKEQQRLQQKMLASELNFEDFYNQLQQIKKMGSLQNVLSLIPGMSGLKDLTAEDGQLKKFEAIILSMTPKERRTPDLLNTSRRKRIASGSGNSIADVNAFIKQFHMMQKMLKNVGRLGRMGKMFTKGLPF